MSEEERDWSEIPADLIHLIAKKLPDLLDFIRFRAVCKTWRSSALLSDPPPQLPWLLELFETVFSFCSLRKRQRYYSFSSRETLVIPFTDTTPRLESWIKRGGCSHYLAFAEVSQRTISFYNPLTQDLFTPPPTCSDVSYPSIVWTGTDPIRNRNIMFLNHDLFLQTLIGGWALYDPPNNQWVEHDGYYKSSCYWQGLLFATHSGGPTEVFDAFSKELLDTIPPSESECTNVVYYLRESYLVVSAGMILRVLWLYDGELIKTIEDSVFHIYRLDYGSTDNKPCWVWINDIGDQIIFLEEMNGFSITARPSTGFKQGCVYFIDPEHNKPYVYDVVANTVERVPCPFERCTWFLPSL